MTQLFIIKLNLLIDFIKICVIIIKAVGGQNMKQRKWFSALLIAVSLLMMFVGVNRGEADIVLSKAIRICLECIGIG